MSTPVLDGITARTISSKRLTTRVLFSGEEDANPVIFVHGNVSDATFWEETMLALPQYYRGIAMDQRGFGEADPDKKIDATRGLGDLADDLKALIDELNIEGAHFVGHSAGGSVLWRFLMDYSQHVFTLTMIAPGSPYGFGGTKDLDGTPNFDDFAGSGGGTVNAAFPPLLAAGERGAEDPNAPRNVMNAFYWKPPFKPAREEDLLSSMLKTHVGPQDYPADMTASTNWPNVAPGQWGLINALTPKYAGDVSALYRLAAKPPILWVRGSDDQIVGDNSFFDLANLGALGFVPGWPGAEVAPPQPMVGQTRAVLEAYQEHGGSYVEVVIDDAGHTPFIEKPEDFHGAFHPFITGGD